MPLSPALKATLAAALLTASSLAAPAASAAVLDTDGDRLLDVWETDGYDYNRDGIIDIDFAALGADPYRKDLFIEMDYMPDLLATEAELDTIVDTFAQMPIWNPDGSTGITLHLDAGSIYPKYDLGGGNEMPLKALSGVAEAQTLRATQSDPARHNVFHYMIWGDNYGTGSSSGQAYVNYRTFIVTVGPTYWGKASSSIRIGTFIHELGHNLGLGHGGTDETHRKPQYMSVMNYKYQISGLRKADGSISYGYSSRTGITLDESAVVESRGLGNASRGFQTSINGRWWTANQGIDFDRDGVIESEPQSIDLNGDNLISSLSSPNDLQTLRFQVWWGNLAGLNANAEAESEEEQLIVESNELTAEEARQLGYLPAQ
ncbi:MAG: zinc-dependent metalloprotease family protein [Rothia sp. (in: high G+C Gram-positive bacteria)]|nr:zinc-dependent metalloprotease family protein [Rothia sp. (in: high G+C Gram-positive bacteria)]